MHFDAFLLDNVELFLNLNMEVTKSNASPASVLKCLLIGEKINEDWCRSNICSTPLHPTSDCPTIECPRRPCIPQSCIECVETIVRNCTIAEPDCPDVSLSLYDNIHEGLFIIMIIFMVIGVCSTISALVQCVKKWKKKNCRKERVCDCNSPTLELAMIELQGTLV